MRDSLEKIVSYLPVYIPDLVQIVSGPKQFVAERNRENKADIVKAFTFFGVSLSIFFILQSGFNVPGKDFWTNAAIHGILYLLFVVLFSAVLRLSWKIVGGKADYQRFLITSSYYMGVLLMGMATATLCFIAILRLFYPDSNAWLAKFVADPNLRRAYNPDPRISRGILVAFTAFLAVAISTFVWGFVGWGAYRELNQLSRSRSCMALFLTILFSLPVAAVLFMLMLEI